MNSYTIRQAAEAMGVQEIALQELLDQSGILAINNNLTLDQIQELMEVLQRQNDEAARRSQKTLEQLVDRYAVLIDTCSLLHPQFPQLMEHLVPLLQRRNKPLVIPSGVIHELQSLAVKKPELKEQIDQLLPQLASLCREHLVRICGGEETFGDKQLLEAALHYATSNDLLVITQDQGLTQDLIRQRSLSSVRGRSLLVNRINKYGYLSRSQVNRESAPSTSNRGWHWVSTSHSGAPISQKTAPSDNAYIPGVGELVQGTTQSWRLPEPLASGGEGDVYDLGDGTVAKLYRFGQTNQVRTDKLRLMVSSPVDCQGVCWPQELLTNSRGQVVGYRMAKAQGLELQKALFTRSALERNFPHWERKDLVQLGITILEKVAVLHDKGILLGDINPLNILVKSSTEVWLVDCDSYQVGRYPCPVGTERFTAPEIQNKEYDSFLRTRGNENFALAVLVFMLLLPGKHPYSQQGGEDMGQLIREGNFPYPFADHRAVNTPDGDWRFMWSHLPYSLKEVFYETFQKGGKRSGENNRDNVWRWLKSLRFYHKCLTDGSMKDPASQEIYPTRLKVADAQEREAALTRTCAECGEPFQISARQQESLAKRGYQLPTRCPLCRKLRRMLREEMSQQGA